MGKATRSSVLHVTITHPIYPITETVLGQIFDVYGVNEVFLLQKPPHVEALVEFRSWRQARKARGALHARCIYDGCCVMDIQHAPPNSVSVHRLSNSERVLVDGGRLASSPPPPASTAARNSKKAAALPAAPQESSSVAKPSTTLALNTNPDTDAINIRFMPLGATALEIPSDRPSFVTRSSYGAPPASTAVFLPPETPTGPPARRIVYAYITPAEVPCRAQPGPFIRLVFRTLALDLPQTFQVRPSSSFGADAAMRFRTPHDTEAAMRRQPFELDGATVKLVRDDDIPCVRLASNDYIVHAALHRYPVEQRAEKTIEGNCSGFGYVREVDPACFAAPDLATVRVVLQLEDPAEIPQELRIKYRDGSISVVPVEVVRVWHRSHSYDAHGQYVRIFQHPAVAD